MLYITAIIKTDFHNYFYRTVVLKKGTGKLPLLQPQFSIEEKKKTTVPFFLRRQGDCVTGTNQREEL